MKTKIDFEICNFVEHLRRSIPSKDKYVKVDTFSNEEIINKIKQSSLSSTIEETIYRWPGNEKYFITDKGFVYSRSVYETGTQLLEYYSNRTKFDYLNHPTKYEGTGYKAQRQVQLLHTKKDGGFRTICQPPNQIQLVIKEEDAESFINNGFKIYETPILDKDGKEVGTSLSIKINYQRFVQWCQTGEYNRNLFTATDGNGATYTFNTKKECYEQLFKKKMSYITFKRAIKAGKWKNWVFLTA